MATYSVIAHDGKMYGPADEMALSQWAREGRLAAHTMLHCHETGARLLAGTLRTVGTVFGLSQQQVNQLLNAGAFGQAAGGTYGQPAAAPQHAPAGPTPQYAQPQPPGMANYPQPGAGQPYPVQAQQPLQYAGPVAYASPGVVMPHTLTSFPVALVVVFHLLTFGLFSLIHFHLMHDRMPKVRRDDPSAGKAIGFFFIPFFNLYWIFFANLRLVDRIDEQRVMVGLRPSNLKGLAITCAVCQIIPFVNYMSLFILWPIFSGMLRASVNELVRASGR